MGCRTQLLYEMTRANKNAVKPGDNDLGKDSVESVRAWIGDEPVDVASIAVTAAVTLLAVVLGGCLTVWNQDRIWRREHARQWRDIRLSSYQSFLSAYREFLAFIQDPSSKITTVPHPSRTGELMPFFDEVGRPYREKLESARMGVTLVSQEPETRDALFLVMRRVRAIAAARATKPPGEIASDLFQDLFAAHNAFMAAARKELGLPNMSGDL
jgi:hypothetical protein